MRFLSLFIPILFSLNTLPALNSETNSPTYKFTIVNGEPTALNASDTLQVSSFEECIEKCEKDSSCIMAYQANSSDPCYLFAWNSVQEVRRNESGGVGTVAFKVYTDQPSCELNSPFLMNGRIYPLNPNDTSNFLWKIDTSEDGWTITYIQKREEENIVCGNFTFDRPYPDSCDPECMITMVQLSGEPGPLSFNPNTFPASSWKECLNACYNNRECFVPYFQDGVSVNCTWYKIDDIWFLNRTAVTEGKHTALKLPLSNRSCKLTTDQLLNDQYYLVDKKIGWAFVTSFFRVRTTPKYYKMQFYLDEEPQFVRTVPGCESNFIGSRAWENGKDPKYWTNPIICMRAQKVPGGITYAAAKELCNEWDGKLMTERHEGFFQMCPMTFENSVLPWYWMNPYRKMGFPEWKEKDIKIWMGLEKDQSSGQFKWLEPKWAVTDGRNMTACNKFDSDYQPGKGWTLNEVDAYHYKANKVVMTWAPGQPVNQPGLDCAYTIHKAKQLFPGYGHYTSTCDAELADGFVCGTPRQQDKGIPKYLDMVAEYGTAAEPFVGVLWIQ